MHFHVPVLSYRGNFTLYLQKLTYLLLQLRNSNAPDIRHNSTGRGSETLQTLDVSYSFVRPKHGTHVLETFISESNKIRSIFDSKTCIIRSESPFLPHSSLDTLPVKEYVT
jgi:hypothetical protein